MSRVVDAVALAAALAGVAVLAFIAGVLAGTAAVHRQRELAELRIYREPTNAEGSR